MWHDGLEECHRIVQRSPRELVEEGSRKSLVVRGENDGGKADAAHLKEMESTFAFWHAIVHRREGDFSNSKYWYARCEGHAVLGVMAAQAAPVLNPMPAG